MWPGDSLSCRARISANTYRFAKLSFQDSGYDYAMGRPCLKQSVLLAFIVTLSFDPSPNLPTTGVRLRSHPHSPPGSQALLPPSRARLGGSQGVVASPKHRDENILFQPMIGSSSGEFDPILLSARNPTCLRTLQPSAQMSPEIGP